MVSRSAPPCTLNEVLGYVVRLVHGVDVDLRWEHREDVVALVIAIEAAQDSI